MAKVEFEVLVLIGRTQYVAVEVSIKCSAYGTGDHPPRGDVHVRELGGGWKFTPGLGDGTGGRLGYGYAAVCHRETSCVFVGEAFLAQIALDLQWLPVLDCPITTPL
jgi:hypothetical protein